MKTILLISLAAALALAAGCESFNIGLLGGPKPKEEKPTGKGLQKGAVEVVINYAEGQPLRQMVVISGTASVLETTRAAAQVETELTSAGEQRVVSIGGDRNGERAGRIWVFEVNNLPQSGAANTIYVHPGDAIRWRYR